ncbi:MAG: SusD/RagB family nutrient-binding outer membrane lipoprotein [Sphingobacteriaceae bacterium]|nr:MAG: SusD/RagB family nutrient-binding outer membrane lipoprotein [Sphingobacteriaceae bacterium]
MKNRIYNYLSVGILLITLLPSCTKDFAEINTDPNGVPDALPQQLLAPALANVVSANMLRNRNFNNELMQVTVNQSDDDAAIFRYDYRNTIADGLYNSWYAQLTNFKDIYNIASQPVTLNKSYQGISLICQSWIYSMLTDTYGDVPYFRSNLARDSSVYEPPFDKQKDIYLDIFKQLENANTLLSSNTAITASSDPVYYGNVSRWRKFGNSLYLRLLLKLSGKSEVSADMIAKIKQIVDTDASSYPIMTSNDDSAILRWTGGVYVSPYQTVREQDWRQPAIGDFFISHLRDWFDPRINISTYATSGFNRWGIAQGPNGFAGVPSGYLAGTGAAKQSYFYSNTSAVSLQTEPLTGQIMNYAELQYILAEASVKGYIATGTAQTYWETGVLNGITLWLPTWPNAPAAGAPAVATTINTPEFRKYLTDADISWDNTLSLNDKMEKIHLQKYYSLFLEDLQQWFEYRRTGHPILPKGPGLRNGGVMPARMTYPVYVQSANPTNYKNAVASQGPDAISTQVWWQKF